MSFHDQRQWIIKEGIMTTKLIFASIILILGYVVIGVFLTEFVMWVMSRLDGRTVSNGSR